MNLHILVSGTISQKPTVVIVTKPHHSDIGIDVNRVASTPLSTKYTPTEPIKSIIENNRVTAAYSSLYSQIALMNHLVSGIFLSNLITLNTLNILNTFQNSHTANTHKKKGKKDIKSIILPNDNINDILCFALNNLYKYSAANIIEMNASNINNSCLYISMLSHMLSNMSTEINATIKKVIKRLKKTPILLFGFSRILFSFTGFSAKIRCFNFVITRLKFIYKKNYSYYSSFFWLNQRITNLF